MSHHGVVSHEDSLDSIVAPITAALDDRYTNMSSSSYLSDRNSLLKLILNSNLVELSEKAKLYVQFYCNNPNLKHHPQKNHYLTHISVEKLLAKMEYGLEISFEDVAGPLQAKEEREIFEKSAEFISKKKVNETKSQIMEERDRIKKLKEQIKIKKALKRNQQMLQAKHQALQKRLLGFATEDNHIYTYPSGKKKRYKQKNVCEYCKLDCVCTY